MAQPPPRIATDERQSAPTSHWRRRSHGTQLSREQAARQGNITNMALTVLGTDQAISFLNTDNPLLGGRPIALATESHAGQLHVEAELGRMRERQVEALESTRAVAS